VIDRLKGLHDRVCLRANMAGELEVGVETEFVFMNNFWKDLEAPALDGQPPPPKDPSQKGEVVVDGGVLGRVLSSYQLRPNVSILCEIPLQASLHGASFCSVVTCSVRSRESSAVTCSCCGLEQDVRALNSLLRFRLGICRAGCVRLVTGRVGGCRHG
jgi:hypothetical protein